MGHSCEIAGMLIYSSSERELVVIGMFQAIILSWPQFCILHAHLGLQAFCHVEMTID